MIQELSTNLHGRRLASQIIVPPAIGDEVIITVPAGRIWEPFTLHAELAAGVGGGNRRAMLIFTVGLAPCAMAFCHDTQPATTTNFYHFLAGYHEYFDFGAINETYQGFPRGILLAAGDQFGTQLINIQATDQWQNIAFSYFETLTP